MIQSFVGENEVVRAREVQRRVVEFGCEHGEMAVEKLDGEEASYERILEAVQSLPFLASKKLVLLRHPSSCKEFVDSFEQFLSEVADRNDVLIVESKLDKRLAYYKQLKKLTDFHEYNVLDTNGLVRYAQEVASEQGAALHSTDARYLIERIGTNQLLLQNEVQKLAIAHDTITRAVIDAMTEKTPQSTVFDLLEAAFAGNAERTMHIYNEQKSRKVEPQQIIAMLAWQLHILALVKAAGQRSSTEIAAEANLKPYVVSKSMDLARRLSYEKIKEYVKLLRELDERTKTDGTLPDEAVRYYLLKLSTQI